MDHERGPQNAPSVEQYKNLLTELSGVLSAKVALDDLGSIREIHVLASADRDIKQVVRDVRSALSSYFDVDIDRRVISVAQMKGDAPPVVGGVADPSPVAGKADSACRLRCGRVSQSMDEDGGYAVTVTLKRGNKAYDGSCSSRNTEPQRMVCVSNAVISAVHGFLGRDELFRVVSVKRIASLMVPVCMVLVEYTGDASPQMLVGATEIGADEAVSVEHATLDAINRKIQCLVGRAKG